jgi:hypothetical protein
MNVKQVLMGLGLVAGVWLVFFTDKSSDSDVVSAVVKPAGSALPVVKTSTSKNERAIPILAIAPRQTLISVGHVGLDGKQIAVGSQIFAAQSWVSPPPPPVTSKLIGPPPPPSAPPLKFTYLGKKFEAGVWEVYLARGDESFIVRAQSVIDGTYRVDSVTPNALFLTHLPTSQVQRLDIRG